FMTLLCAFAVLLWRHAGAADFAVGAPIAGRARRELEGLIGLLVNSLVLRADLRGRPSFAVLLARLRATALGAYAHQALPFERLVDELAPERSLRRSPLFQVMFGLQSTQLPAAAVPGLDMRPEGSATGAAKFDLMLLLAESAGRLVGRLDYRSDLF